jgi:MSHA pilin protein MshC
VFQERGFASEILSALGYAHKLAIASGCPIRVVVNASGYRVDRWADPADCTDQTAASALVQRPGGGGFQGSAPNGVSVSGPTFFFDRIGRPRDVASGALITHSADLTIGVGGVQIQIEPETGFVREL